jgi:hypothetical protein
MSSQTSHKVGADGAAAGGDKPMGGLAGRLAFAWAFVGIPLAYGIFETAKKAAALFTG